MEKRFSIIIPTYNVEDYITKCLNSINEQTFSSYEVIIVDSASKDNTVNIINNILEDYNNDNFKLIKGDKTLGPGKPRNIGINSATGQYIIFLDADDYLNNKNVLEKLDKIIGDSTPDVVYMGFEISGDRKEIVIPTHQTCTKKYKASLDKYPNVWSKCWKRDLLTKNKIEFQENMYYEDVLFLYKAVMKTKDYLIADFPVHTYISGRKNSITTTLSFQNIYDTVKNIEEMVKLNQKEKTEELNIIIQREINMCKKRLEQIIKKAE